MSRYSTTGRIAIVFAPTVANTSAPTAAEINAGTNLTSQITRDGVKTPATGNTIDIADISSRFNKTAPGTYGGDALELMFHRDSKSASDTAWTTLARDTQGFVIVARSGLAQNGTTGLGTPTGTATTGDRVEVYPVTVITRAMQDTADNESSKFTVQAAITGEPADNAVVA